MQHEILQFPKREISVVETNVQALGVAAKHNWVNPSDEAEELAKLKFMGLSLAMAIIIVCYEKGLS